VKYKLKALNAERALSTQGSLKNKLKALNAEKALSLQGSAKNKQKHVLNAENNRHY
jgi:hypothetical protein